MKKKSEAKQPGGALAGNEASVWAASSGRPGSQDSLGCVERRSLGSTQTRLPPLPSGHPARCKCRVPQRGLEAFQFFLRVE